MRTSFGKPRSISKPVSSHYLRSAAVGVIAAACVFAAPRVAHAAGSPDTVFLSDGGRIRGTVMVEDNKEVRIQLVDGSTKVIEKKTVQRVQYGDAAAPPAAAVTPPVAAPVTPAPAPVPPVAQSAAGVPRNADYDDAPPRRRHSHYVSNDDDYSPPPRTVMRSPGLVAGGAVMVSFGLCAMIAGAIGTAAMASSDNTDALPEMLLATEGGGALLLIPGAVMIAVGRKRVPAKSEDAPDPEAMIFQPKINGFQLKF